MKKEEIKNEFYFKSLPKYLRVAAGLISLLEEEDAAGDAIEDILKNEVEHAKFCDEVQCECKWGGERERA